MLTLFLINFVLAILLIGLVYYFTSCEDEDLMTFKNLVREDIKNLGIDAKVITLSYISLRILFKSVDDLNLYKLSGSFTIGLNYYSYFLLDGDCGKLAYLQVLCDRIILNLPGWKPWFGYKRDK